MRKKGFTLIELLVVIAIIAMLLAILMPALSKVKKIAQRVICGTNLKGLGTAQMVYANDYDDEYTVQGGGGAHTWDRRTGGWLDPLKDWRTANTITVGASLYLLVREADVSPKSFICPSGGEKEFDGKNTNNLDIVELWDFGSYTVEEKGPENCVSYSYQGPYVAGGTGVSTGAKSRFAADGTRSASFAVMSDQNPWFENPRLISQVATQDNYKDRVWKMGNGQATTAALADGSLQKYEIEVGNAQPHDRDGQNVLFADGHASYEKRTDVGIKNDNIFTPHVSGGTGADSTYWRVGSLFNDIMTKSVPRSSSDSVLVNDGELAPTS